MPSWGPDLVNKLILFYSIVSSAIFGETYEHKSDAAVCYGTHFICLYKDVYLEWKHFVYSLLKA